MAGLSFFNQVMNRLYNAYLNTFRGLSKEIWWLALITLINRAGAMVIPFLSLYLKDDLDFTLPQIGWVMTSFGFGSFFGSWLGGNLADKIGYYKVILFSFLGTGIGFLLLQFLTTFWAICFGFFTLIAIADASRPAFFVALSAYSKPENKTRSLTLIRLAINLGFSAGPALGGIIITTLGYYGLFWADGITCILAGILLTQVLHPKKAKITDQEVRIINPVKPQRDYLYMLFLLVLTLFGFVFVQFFSTVPLYYKEVRGLSEEKIGLLLGLNGLLIFLFEMPLIAYLESLKKSSLYLVKYGILITAISFLAFFIKDWQFILVIGMAIVTLGEMITFPFGNAFALERSRRGKQGAYMGLYSMSFSLAHIFGHNTGMQLVDKLGYNYTWSIMIMIGLVAMVLLRYTRKKLTLENERKTSTLTYPNIS